MKIFDLIRMIYRLYAHVMGEVEIEGLSYERATIDLLKAMNRLEVLVSAKLMTIECNKVLIAARVIKTTPKIDREIKNEGRIKGMMAHIRRQTSVCTRCLDLGCGFCDGSMDQHI